MCKLWIALCYVSPAEIKLAMSVFVTYWELFSILRMTKSGPEGRFFLSDFTYDAKESTLRTFPLAPL